MKGSNTAENHNLKKAVLLEKVHEVVCWTTWQTIAEVVQEQVQSINIPEQSVAACVQRLANAVIRSVTWHS